MAPIDDKDLAFLDQRYKKIEDCDTEMKDVTNQHHGLDTRLTVIEKQLNLILKILAFIGTGVGALIIGSLWKVIAK